MKKLCLLLTPFLIILQAKAQTGTDDYTIWSVGIGTMFPQHPGRNVVAAFPYTVTPAATGNATRQVFTGSTDGSFASTAYSADLLNAEIVRKKLDIDIGLGMYRDAGSNYGGYLKGGYRYILPFGRFLLKPSVDLYYLFGSDIKMGSIDNRDQAISLFGYTAHEQFDEDYTDPDDGTTTTSTYNADHMDVSYRRNSFLAEPKIVLALKPTGRFAFSVEGGWMFQVAQSCVLKFTQSDGSSDNHTNLVGKVHLPNNGSLGGPYVGFNVGMCLWPKSS